MLFMPSITHTTMIKENILITVFGRGPNYENDNGDIT